MMTTVFINDLPIDVEQYKHEIVEKEMRKLHRLELNFQVTHQQYHDITVELYKNDFQIKVPKENIEFRSVIETYSTSITNLYEENAVGDFHVALIETN
jgi:hypothetical protein